MKYSGLLLIVCLLTLACKQPSSLPSGDKEVVSHASNKGKYVVSGRLMYTAAYCGGAAPTNEILESLAIPRPMSGIELRAQKGNVNDPGSRQFKKAITNEKGEYTLHLGPGEWCITTASKGYGAPVISNTPNTIVNEECVKKWQATCDRVVQLQESESALRQIKVPDITLYKACFVDFQPCTQYRGPLPPSAPPRGR